MRRGVLAGAGVLVAVCCARGLAGGPTSPGVPSRRVMAGRAFAGPSGTGAPSLRPAARADPRPPPGAWRAVVRRVVDGDTLVLWPVRRGGTGHGGVDPGPDARVRLIGLDAPETRPRPDCYGAAATRALRRLVPPGAVVRVIGDRESYDRFGRRLLYLWTAHGRFVAVELVRAGLARALPVPPDTRYAVAVAAAEATARHARSGLWRACA